MTLLSSRCRCSAPLAIALALLATGCAKFDLRKNIPWGEGKDGFIAQPMRAHVAWVDGVQTKPGEPSMRGFGGRVFFFGPNQTESAKVEGTLVVYAFNETNRDPRNVVPDRKYVFPPEVLEKLYSKSKAGHSYSVWVPWDEAGGPQTDVSLICRFTPAKGGVVTSEQMRVLLPGIVPLIDVQNVQASQSAPPTVTRIDASPLGPVQQVAYQEQVNAQAQHAAQQMAAGPNVQVSYGAPGSYNTQKMNSYTIPLRASPGLMHQMQTGSYPQPWNHAQVNAMTNPAGQTAPFGGISAGAGQPTLHTNGSAVPVPAAPALPSPPAAASAAPSNSSGLAAPPQASPSAHSEREQRRLPRALTARQPLERARWEPRLLGPQFGHPSGPLQGPRP